MSMKKNLRPFSRLAKLACATAFLLFTISGLAQQPLQILHNHVRSVVSSGQAAPAGSLPPEQRMQLAIMLPLRNQTDLTSLLGRLYDPSSPDYRQFLSVDQFTKQFGPTAEEYQAVVDFAEANGFTVTSTPSNRLLVDVNGSVAQIEKAFHVSMKIYRHPTQSRTFFSPDREPALDLSVPVSHIAGLNNFFIPHPMKAIMSNAHPLDAPSNSGSGPGLSYLASDMRAAYYGDSALTGSGQTVGLLEFGGYNLSDVTSTFYGHSYSVPINNVLVDTTSAAPSDCDNGDPGSPVDDSEQVLDIAQAIGMAPGLSQVRVYIGPCPWDVGVNDAAILNKMASENIAKQLSISWHWSPDDPSTDDVFFEEFAAQGQSVFAASGDDGAYVADSSPYPAEDAYVTAVGGTDLNTDLPGGPWLGETAWSDSGGGFSPDGIVIPSWQVGVANSSNGASTTLRNVPDVAMEANQDNYLCAMGVCQENASGTSFAAPRWAGFMALINQQAVAVTTSKSVLGFINPALYSIGKGSNYDSDFHDITSGGNGHSATTGYDLVTGWGSPNGQSMINALVGPVAAPPTITAGRSICLGEGSTLGLIMSDSTAAATIYYTTNGTTPTTSSTKYAGEEIIITESTTFKAFAVASGFWNSAITTATLGPSCGGIG
jgi:subtilase family serine protease